MSILALDLDTRTTRNQWRRAIEHAPGIPGNYRLIALRHSERTFGAFHNDTTNLHTRPAAALTPGVHPDTVRRAYRWLTKHGWLQLHHRAQKHVVAEYHYTLPGQPETCECSPFSAPHLAGAEPDSQPRTCAGPIEVVTTSCESADNPDPFRALPVASHQPQRTALPQPLHVVQPETTTRYEQKAQTAHKARPW